MEKLDNFKAFVKKNPSLLKYVRNNEMTWQKFYEMYDMYGETNNIWNDYIKSEEVVTSTLSTVSLLDFIKSIDLDKVQESINSVSRVVGVLEDLGKNKETKPEYKPRPLYKHFED